LFLHQECIDLGRTFFIEMLKGKVLGLIEVQDFYQTLVHLGFDGVQHADFVAAALVRSIAGSIHSLLPFP
jgi:hypothetical protein